jgi:hypothetical protein
MPHETREWVNPGDAASPIVGTDWFSSGDDAASSTIDIAAAQRQAGYGILVRKADGRAIAPSGILVQGGELAGGNEYNGYTIRYGDRIQLCVDAVDRPLDTESILSSTDMTTTAGQTLLWRRTSVRGFDAVERPSAVQKWESGRVNRMPSVLRWTEPSSEGPPYVHYALLGDVPVGVLQALAGGLSK